MIVKLPAIRVMKNGVTKSTLTVVSCDAKSMLNGTCRMQGVQTDSRKMRASFTFFPFAIKPLQIEKFYLVEVFWKWTLVSRGFIGYVHDDKFSFLSQTPLFLWVVLVQFSCAICFVSIELFCHNFGLIMLQPSKYDLNDWASHISIHNFGPVPLFLFAPTIWLAS